ncbi:MAG TPA: HEAT repeat domain-containing protein [Polyangiaceae bacterium]|jgi:hypothetical protein
MPHDNVLPFETIRDQLREHDSGRLLPASARARTAWQLASYPAVPQAAQLLLVLLQDDHPMVRTVARESLATVFEARPAAVLECMADEAKCEDARRCFQSIARFVGRVGTTEALDVLLAALARATDADDRTWLLERVARTGCFPTELLRLRLREEAARDSDHAEYVAEILARRGDDEGHRQLLRGGSDTVVARLLECGADGFRTLCRVARELEPEAQDEIARQLGALRRKTEPTVRELARDRSAPGALLATMTLGYWDEPEYVEMLLAMWRDAACPADLRRAALESLCRLEAPEAIDDMCEAVLDDRMADYTKWCCAEALGEIGNHAALPALEAVVRAKPETLLGQYARQAIAAIGTDVEAAEALPVPKVAC